MIPGATIFLYLLPLAAAPVVFHLLMRRRRRRIMFSTKMFFDRVNPRLTFHRKLRDMLLLASRVLLIALLLLALARVTVTGMGDVLGLGGNQAVVVIVDNSASMGAHVKDATNPKLRTALEGARTLLENMEEGAEAGVVTLVPDPGAGQWGGMTSKRELLLDYLEKLRATEATGDPAKAILQAMALLRESAPAGGGSIHIFTDLQETEWKEKRLDKDDVRENVKMFFHRLPSEPAKLPNVCVVSAKTSSRRILPRQPYNVEVLLRNDGDKDIKVRVNRKDSEYAIADEKTVTIAGKARKTVKLPFRPQANGQHWIRVWIEGDGFAGDNTACISYICEKKGDVYFVGNEAAGDFGLFPLAVSPQGDGQYTSLVPSFHTLEKLPASMKDKRPMLVVLKWADVCSLSEDMSKLLETYITDGGNLFVLPSVAGNKPSGKPPAWLGAELEDLKVLERSSPLLVSDATSEFWSDLRGLDGEVRIGGAHVKQYYPLSLTTNAKYSPLLGCEGNGSLMAIRGFGKGQITVSGIAFSGTRQGVPQWSTLPTKNAFLVMAQPIALGAVSSLASEGIFLVAGNTPGSLPGKGAEVSIVTLTGDRVAWTGPRDQVPLLVRGGAYIVSSGERKTCMSVMPSDLEGNDAFIKDPKVAAVGEIPHKVRELSDEEDFRDELESSVAGTALYLPLLLLATVTLIAEGLLGSPALQRKIKPTGGEEQEGWGELGTGPTAESGGEDIK